MDFKTPEILILMIPWLVLVAIFFIRQSRAWKTAQALIAPRFIGRFSVFSRLPLPVYTIIVALMGALLIAAAAGPYHAGSTEQAVRSANVILVIDASFSMIPSDTAFIVGIGKSKTRLKEACAIASEIIKQLPSYRFGLISFSGIAAVHSPPTTDYDALHIYLKNFKLHSFQKTGSNFKEALGAAIHLVERSKRSGFQVVMISDGEGVESDNYDDEVSILKKKKIPVHAIGVGTSRGMHINIFNPRDLVLEKAKPEVAKQIKTSRKDNILGPIADQTGGTYLVMENKPYLWPIINAIKKSALTGSAVQRTGRADQSHWFLLAFAILILTDLCIIDGWNLLSPLVRRLSRIRPHILIAAIALMLAGCNNAAWNSHRCNENGIDRYNRQHYPDSRKEYEKSIGFQFKEELPMYNLANSYLREGNFSQAHQGYEQALRINPELPEALYNDGHALYQWGKTELDPDCCRIERTVTLWSQAMKRFDETRALAGATSELGVYAKANRDRIEQQIIIIKKKHEENRDKCKSKKQQQKKDQRSKENKEQKNKTKNPKKGENKRDARDRDKDPSAGKDGDRDDNGNRADASSKLSADDRRTVKAALERIKTDAGTGTLRQSKPQQLRKGKGRENVGDGVYW